MADTYFSKFKQIQYANNIAVDLTERVVISDGVAKNPYMYYPMDITNGTRADSISYASYDDPYRSWIIYLTNKIIDPYYEWYLTQEQFNSFIKNKYGSLQQALEKVSHYINNWCSGNDISISDYNALTSLQKTYYEPNYGHTKIISYSRKKSDFKSSTNFMLNIGITGTQTFIHDEIVDIKYQSNTHGKAQVVQANNTNVVVQHIFDDAFPHDSITISGTSYIKGQESNSNCQITSCTFIANNIPVDVQAYWTPVYYYDLENEKNEGNRTIRVMQQPFLSSFSSNVKSLLGQ